MFCEGSFQVFKNLVQLGRLWSRGSFVRKLAAGFPVMVRPERRCTDMPTPNGIEAKSSYKNQS